MFNFLNKGSAARELGRQPGSKFEIMRLTPTGIAFRCNQLYPLLGRLQVGLRGATGDGGIVTRNVPLVIRAARVIEENSYLYEADLLLPPEWSDWVKTAGQVPESLPTVAHEQRRGRRASNKFQVTSKDLRSFKALSADISSSGIRLAVDDPVEVGQRLDLAMDFDDFRFPMVRAQAEVVWCRRHTETSWMAGLRFVEMREEDRLAIEDYVDFVGQRGKRRGR